MNIELEILNAIQKIENPICDAVMCFITHFGDAGIIWIVMSAILLINPKTRKSGIVMIVSLCIDALICNVMLKNMVARIRPYDVNTQINILISKPVDFSFPSGHTAASFAAVAALFFEEEKKLWKISIVPSCLIAFSRMYLYVHYPTDILGGVIVGIISGYIGHIIVRHLGNMKSKKNNKAMER